MGFCGNFRKTAFEEKCRKTGRRYERTGKTKKHVTDFSVTGEFCLIGIADRPIDVSTATAVVIGDLRIELKDG